MSWRDILKISTEDAIQDAHRFSDDPDVIDQLFREHKKKKWEEYDREYPDRKNWCDLDRSIALRKGGWECRHSEEEVREKKEKYGEYGENRYPEEKKRWLENRKKEQNPIRPKGEFEGIRDLVR